MTRKPDPMRKAIPTHSSLYGGPIIDAQRQSPIRSVVDSLQSLNFEYAPLVTHFDHLRKRLPSLFLLCAVALSLTGCGWSWPDWANKPNDPLAFLGDEDTEEDQAPPPPSLIHEDSPDQTDPRSSMVPASTVDADLETYFLQDIKDPELRMQRLENVVLAMHRDMQTILNIQMLQRKDPQNAPSYSVAAPVNQQPIPTTAPPTPLVPPSPAPPPAQVITPPTPPPAPAITSSTAITGVRFGKHPGSVRIVFDTTGPTPYKADLDNGEHILVVELPEASWQGAASVQPSANSAVLQSFKAEPSGAGTRVVFQLKANTNIVYQKILPALAGPGQRIIVDLRQ